MNKLYKSCGAQRSLNTAFCGACGTPDSEGTLGGAADGVKVESKKASGPMDFLKASTRTNLYALRQLLKDPKQLVPMLILSAIWLLLSILPALGVNPWPVRLLSFLTFAQGGMYGGLWGALGGLFGKAVFAYFISTLILPLFFGNNPFKGLGYGWKAFFSAFGISGLNAAVPLVFGAGTALILFNFLTGNAEAVNSMAGIAGFLLAVRSLSRQNGFLWGLAFSIVNKLSKGRMPHPVVVVRAISGYAVGSATGTVLSLLRLPWLPYVLGALLLIIGLAFSTSCSGKGAASA